MLASHRLEHLTQAQRSFSNVFGRDYRTGLVCGDRKDVGADLVTVTVQSLNRSLHLIERTFDYVVVDEFHHAAAKSYRKFLEATRPKFLLGLTATPERQDGHDVVKLCDYNIAYEARLTEAINRKWLIPFHYFGIADQTVDYSESFWRKPRIDLDKMENALMLSDRVIISFRMRSKRGLTAPRGQRSVSVREDAMLILWRICCANEATRQKH